MGNTVQIFNSRGLVLQDKYCIVFANASVKFVSSNNIATIVSIVQFLCLYHFFLVFCPIFSTKLLVNV